MTENKIFTTQKVQMDAILALWDRFGILPELIKETSFESQH